MSLTFIDGEGTSDQYRPKNRSEEQNHFPVRRIMCAHDLQLGVEVQGEEDKTSKRGSRMARRKRLEGVVDIFLVSSADRPVIHVIRKLGARRLRKLGYVWHADGIKVRAKASDQPLDPDLRWS